MGDGIGTPKRGIWNWTWGVTPHRNAYVIGSLSQPYKVLLVQSRFHYEACQSLLLIICYLCCVYLYK